MSIKARFAASSLWIVSGTAANNLSSFVIFAILARLLEPAEVGLMALAAIYIELTRIVGAGGLVESLISHPDWDDQTASTALWGSLAVGVMLVVATVLVATMFGSWLIRGLGAVLTVLSVTCLIDAARIVPEAKLRREFRFRELAARNFVASVLGGVIGILMAFAGFGVWALVAQRIGTSLVHAVLSWLAAGWTPSLHFDFGQYRPMFGVGAPLVLAQLASFANARVSEAALGIISGADAVGFFRVGRRGLDLLVQSTIQPMHAAALSAMARLNGQGAVGGAYVRLTGACAMASAPIFFGTAVIAPDFVRLCFGPQWAPSGDVMTLLSLVVGAATLRYFVGPALTAVGKAREVLAANLLMVGANGIAALVTAPFGVTAVAAGQTVAAYLSLPSALSILRRGVGVEPWGAVAGIAPPMAAAGAMAVLLFLVRSHLLGDASALARVAVLMPLGVFVYVALLAVIGRPYLRRTLGELRPLLPSRLKRYAVF